MKIKPLLAGFALFLSGCSHFQNNQEQELKQLPSKAEFSRREKTPEDRFQEAMKAIASYHENVLGIKYPEKIAPVRFSIPDYISYSQRHDFVGSYAAEENYFEFNPIYRDCDITSLLSPEKVTENTDDINCSPLFLRTFLSHELAHYFVDSLIEAEYPESWLQLYIKEKRHLTHKDLNILIVREGIATYFEKIFDANKEPQFSDNSWKLKFEGENPFGYSVVRWLSYEGGYALVKPIIDKHGLEGIKYLIREKLELEIPNLETIPSYREKALIKLAENKKN